MKKELAIAARMTESVTTLAPTKMKLLHPERVLDAFMKLKYSLSPMQEGELLLGIEGHGTYRLAVENRRALCEQGKDKEAQLTLSAQAAAQMAFGPLPATLHADLPLHALTWFPLPFSWNFLDVV